MDADLIRRLNQVNRQFYTTVAQPFATSRTQPWPGWPQVWQVCWPQWQAGPPATSAELKVLDVGCGTGRFGHFCQQQLAVTTPHWRLRYWGVDQDPHLLALAQQQDSRFQLQELDLVETLLTPIQPPLAPTPPDLIAAFGLLHHIPSQQLRRALISWLVRQLRVGGILALAFWQFDQLPALMARRVAATAVGVSENQLEAGDYFLTWERDVSAIRYCHLVSPTEQEALLAALPVTILARFAADGQSRNINHYWLMQRQEDV